MAPLGRRSRGALALVALAALALATPGAAAWNLTTILSAIYPLPPLPEGVSSNSTFVASADGVQIHTTAWFPSSGYAGLPVIIFSGAWGFAETMYSVVAANLAKEGYLCVGYATRGFGSSGGQVEVASENDIADISAVIDYAGEIGGDTSNVGITGISYGGGLVFLGACHDSRIRSVVSMSGWGDMFTSFFGLETRHTEAVSTLIDVAGVLGHPGSVIDELQTAFDDDDATRVLSFTEDRSPINCIDSINSRDVATLVQSGWRDSIFPPNELIEFYQALTVTHKREELRWQNHAMDSFWGLDGSSNGDWDSVRRWFDATLKGTVAAVSPLPTGSDVAAASSSSYQSILDEPSIWLQWGNGELYESYASWDDVVAGWTDLAIGYDVAGNAVLQDPSSGDSQNLEGWTRSFSTAKTAGADAGAVQVANPFNTSDLSEITAQLTHLDGTFGGVWTSGIFENGLKIRGAPKLSISVSTTATAYTLVAYLYEVTSFGQGTLITHGPISNSSAIAHESYNVDYELFTTLWDVQPGSSIGLVVQGGDDRYASRNPSWASITVGPPAGGYATVSIPHL